MNPIVLVVIDMVDKRYYAFLEQLWQWNWKSHTSNQLV